MVAATIAAQVPDWYERITQETPPDILAEHDLRYTLVAPLIAGSALWCDLGCGNGIGAATALAGRRPGGRVVLVDNDGEAIAASAASSAETSPPARCSTNVPRRPPDSPSMAHARKNVDWPTKATRSGARRDGRR